MLWRQHTEVFETQWDSSPLHKGKFKQRNYRETRNYNVLNHAKYFKMNQEIVYTMRTF